MRLPVRAATAAAVLATMMLAAACAPRNADTANSSQDIGRTASVSYGTIVSMRPLTVLAADTGVGANILGAIGGASVGGGAQTQADRGEAVEFIIREDAGQTVSIVQTNEANFRPGERVVITRGARTRLARGAPPPPPGS